MQASTSSGFQALIMMGLLWAIPSPAESFLEPDSANIAGGAEFSFIEFDVEYSPPTVTLGGVPATFVKSSRPKCGDGIPCGYKFTFMAPPQESPGVVDVVITFPMSTPSVFPNIFTYYDAPVISGVSPSQHSYLPDDTLVTIDALGLSVYPGVQVFFKDRAATQVVVNKSGTSLTCLPPPFPGGPIPLPVDVRVVNPNRAAAVVSEKFEYSPVTPVAILGGIGAVVPAWTLNTIANMGVGHLISGDVRVYVDGVPAVLRQILPGDGYDVVFYYPPAHAPGLASITIVNGDGGIYYESFSFLYDGTVSTDYHTADLNHDFRIGLSELLRVIQYYNAGSYHCEPGSEDGYAPGVGDNSCSPHASDHEPQDWQMGLSEVLEVIEFYNLHCYQPCPGTPGTYCPPTPAS